MNNILYDDSTIFAYEDKEVKEEIEQDPIWDSVPEYIKYACLNKYWIPIEFVKYLKENQFFTKPASLKYHGACEGGLYRHSFLVADTLVKYTKNLKLKWQNDRSPFLIGMFHDICKMDNYKYKPFTDNDDRLVPYVWNDSQILKGHGDKSVMMLSQFFKLTAEEIACIRYHMGAYETDDWDNFDRAIREYPNVLYTHTADMYASKVMEK